MENRLFGVRVALRIRGIATGGLGGSRRYEHVAGCTSGWAWEKDAIGVGGGCAETGALQGASAVRLKKAIIGFSELGVRAVAKREPERKAIWVVQRSWRFGRLRNRGAYHVSNRVQQPGWFEQL